MLEDSPIKNENIEALQGNCNKKCQTSTLQSTTKLKGWQLSKLNNSVVWILLWSWFSKLIDCIYFVKDTHILLILQMASSFHKQLLYTDHNHWRSDSGQVHWALLQIDKLKFRMKLSLSVILTGITKLSSPGCHHTFIFGKQWETIFSLDIFWIIAAVVDAIACVADFECVSHSSRHIFWWL